MKKRYLFLMMSLGLLTANAQVKIDMGGARLLDDYKFMLQGIEVPNPDLRLTGSPVDDGSRSALSVESIGDRVIGAYVEIAPGSSIDDLTLNGAVIVNRRVNETLYSVSVPVSRLEDLMNQTDVRFVTVGMAKETMMLNARPSGNVDKVHAGEGLDRPYTGKGVLVGMFDTGMDPNHLNFRTAADGYQGTRVKSVLAYTTSSGRPTRRADTEEEVLNFTTDLNNQTHGTHVMGIAAGSYNGAGTYNAGNSLREVDNLPLYGVATEADIFMAGGLLYNNNITDGVEEIVDYAEAHGQPAVINLSLGSVMGAHDGTDADSQDLAELGKRAIICVAAGNDGDRKCAATIQGGGLNASSLRNTVGFSRYESGDVNSMLFWNSVSDPFTKLEFILMNVATRQVVYKREIGNLEGATLRLGASGTTSAYEKVSEFDQAFDNASYVTIRTFVNYSNQKYVAEVTNRLKVGADESIVPCFRFTRARGTVITCLNSNGEFTNWGMTGTYTDEGVTYAALTNGTTNGSVSAMSTGDNILVVGAYTSQRTFGYLDGRGGYSYVGASDINDNCPFTSYGANVATGEMFPHVSAPGSVLLSSFNSYYTSGGSLYSQSSGTATVNNQTSYWGPMQGTSMATPFVTGVIALWLEADPNLKIQDVKDVINKTSIKNSYYPTGSSSAEVEKRARWGAGAIDALAGLKEVLDRKSAIGTVWEDREQRLMVEQTEGELRVFVAGESQLKAQLFAVTGALVASAGAEADEVTLAVGGVAKGIYVLTVEGSEGRYTRKIVVR